MKRVVNNLCCLLLITFCFLSCREEIADVGGTLINKEGIQEVFIPLALPQSLQSSLRSMDESAERSISCVDVLAFKKANDGKFYLDYRAKGRNIKTTGFIAELKIASEQYLVVIANDSAGVTAAIESGTTEKVEMLKQLTFSLPSDGKWNTSQDYTPLPMWGETNTDVSVNVNTTAVSAITLLRMVAKIDVVLLEAATVNFQLKEVYLHNYATTGRVVPDADAVQVIENAEGNEGKIVIRPSAPLAGYSKSSNPACFTDFSSPGEANKAMRGAIYAFESEAPAFTSPMDATCLVVGGMFKGEMTYYRVDFISRLNPNTFMNIMRNHQYTIRIEDVKGKGYDTEEEARTHQAINMPVEVLDWSEGDTMQDIIFDSYNYMAVSRDTLAFSRNALTADTVKNRLTLRTNCQNGWYIKSIIDSTIIDLDNTPKDLALLENRSSSWITLSTYRQTVASEKPENVYVRLKPLVSSQPNAKRTAIIIFKADRLEYPVRVTQYNIETPLIQLYEADIDSKRTDKLLDLVIDHKFPNGQGSPSNRDVSFYACWAPNSSYLVVNSSQVTNIPYIIGLNKFPYNMLEPTEVPGETISGNNMRAAKYLISFPEIQTSKWDSYGRKGAKITFSVSNAIETEELTLMLYHEYKEF